MAAIGKPLPNYFGHLGSTLRRGSRMYRRQCHPPDRIRLRHCPVVGKAQFQSNRRPKESTRKWHHTYIGLRTMLCHKCFPIDRRRGHLVGANRHRYQTQKPPFRSKGPMPSVGPTKKVSSGKRSHSPSHRSHPLDLGTWCHTEFRREQ